jgi:hypothetical protein
MSGPRLNAAYYAAPVSEFLAASDEDAYAPLTAPKGYTLAPEQLSAWHLQLPVLRAALARDDLDRARRTDPKARIGTSRSAVKAFIQNVHHFRDDTLRDPAPPDDHVVVFDEAQRAWDARQLASFMKRKKGRPGFTQSESELLLSALDRHDDWAVVVCLVGVRTAFPGWDVFVSPHLTDSEYAATGALARLTESRAKTVPAPISASGMVAGTLFADPALHLATSMRSFRAESLSRFVKALLDGEAKAGRELLESFREQYPILLTRSMRAARRWIRRQRRGTERAGLVASSSARAAQAPRDRHSGEHRPSALVSEPRERHPLVALSRRRGDGVSGAGAGARLDDPHVERRPTLVGRRLELPQFSRGKWTDAKKPERRQYLKNACRALLTRARRSAHAGFVAEASPPTQLSPQRATPLFGIQRPDQPRSGQPASAATLPMTDKTATPNYKRGQHLRGRQLVGRSNRLRNDSHRPRFREPFAPSLLLPPPVSPIRERSPPSRFSAAFSCEI